MTKKEKELLKELVEKNGALNVVNELKKVIENLNGITKKNEILKEYVKKHSELNDATVPYVAMQKCAKELNIDVLDVMHYCKYKTVR